MAAILIPPPPPLPKKIIPVIFKSALPLAGNLKKNHGNRTKAATLSHSDKLSYNNFLWKKKK